ncbi:MAG: SpoIIIAH-like family protein [Clostridia bacterium]|nr:SpoIIIAH-like family protein [Clostridia bacterium]
MEKNRQIAAAVRMASCAALLLLLAVCGYAGASREETRRVSVPVVYETMTAQEISLRSMEETRLRLREEREREVQLLQRVIDDPAAGEETAEQARKQMLQLTERMDSEARTQAALEYMGYTQVAVVCGAQSVSVIAPVWTAQEEQDRIRIIDAAAAQTRLPAEAVKIILSKK